VVLGILGIGLGILANGQNIAFLVALAFRGRQRGQPADHHLFAVLEAVQHPRRPVEHVRRTSRRSR
jgi:hypothetical protein